ncbi:hypothetical protein [uncultured Methanomethylovorans sp.]|uniref:hypothetical protein n=1 Tax=uncultured Methanomethylovorans sp. TaxID=183759 RepID=UPI002AA78155|nr:hypothetical protein [uncultured Methanomethylovorans sp.]
MIWECSECRTRESTYIRPCRADTGVNSVAPKSCLLDPMGTKFKWQKVPEKKATRRKLRSTSILSLKDIAKRSRVCPDSWSKLCSSDPQIDKESEELTRKVELIILGVQA